MKRGGQAKLKNGKRKISTHVSDEAYQRLNMAAAVKGCSVGAVIDQLTESLPDPPDAFKRDVLKALPGND